MANGDHRPLTSAQRETAASLSWYRAWLLRLGWRESEIDPPTEESSP